MSVTFDSLKNTFDESYAEYMVTGSASSQAIYKTARTGMKQLIQNAKRAVENDRLYTSQFLNTYEQDSNDIPQLQTKINEIKTDGPRLQDKLHQTEIMNPNVTAPIDNTERAIKSGVVLAIMLVIGYVSTQ
jgi:CHASE3 domain sensor protein